VTAAATASWPGHATPCRYPTRSRTSVEVEVVALRVSPPSSSVTWIGVVPNQGRVGFAKPPYLAVNLVSVARYAEMHWFLRLSGCPRVPAGRRVVAACLAP
jgi:hypothetical protein